MQINEWLTAKNRQRRVVPIMTHPGIELLGYTVKQAVTNGDIHAQAIIALNDKYPADASTVIMDLTVEAEAFGAKVIFPDHEVPSISEPLLKDAQSVVQLEVPTLNKGRIQEYLKANKKAAESIIDKPVLGGCIGPFSLAGRLYGMSEIMMALYIEPDVVMQLLEKCTTFLQNYCEAIKKTGVDGVIIAEPAAGLISAADCIQYSSNYIKRIVDSVQDDNFAIILHNCGNTGHCTQAMIASNAIGLHFGNKVDMIETLSQCPNDRLVMGNLDPVGLFKQSTPLEVYQVTKDLLHKTIDFKNFVISSGCDIPPETPVENIEAFYKAVYDTETI